VQKKGSRTRAILSELRLRRDYTATTGDYLIVLPKAGRRTDR